MALRHPHLLIGRFQIDVQRVVRIVRAVPGLSCDESEFLWRVDNGSSTAIS